MLAIDESSLLAIDEGNLVAINEENQRSDSCGVRFGWTAIFATVAAAMLVGVWLGCFLTQNSEILPGSNVASIDLNSSNTKLLTPVSFNVQAFNLLHGHSQRAEFRNCGQCHQQTAGKEAALSEIFQGWFYGDVHLFEAHPDGLAECSKCHVPTTDEHRDFAKDKELHRGFSKLVNCSDCHKVDADGFDGFKKDWHSAAISSEG